MAISFSAGKKNANEKKTFYSYAFYEIFWRRE